MKFLGRWLFVFVVVGVAHAAGLSDRLYVAGDMGFARRELDGPLRSQPQVLPESSAVFRKDSSNMERYAAVHVGVNVNEFLAIEAGYQDFGTTDVRMIPPPNVVFITAPPENFHFRDRAFTVDPVFRWKIGARMKLHFFLGVAFNRTDVSVENYLPVPAIGGISQAKNSRTTQSRLGAGANLQLTPRLDLGLGVDYQRFSSFTKEGWLLHAGFVYTF